MPATTTTVLSWMSEDLALTVKAENFQSYLSAVNKAHVHLELDKPAVGDRVTAVRQSIKGGQVPVTVEDQRVRLPADVVADALDEAVNGDVSNDLLRSTAAVVTDSACCSRGDTGVGIRDSDVRLRSDRGVVIRLRNHKGDVKRAELTGEERVLVFEPDAVVGLYEVLARWFLRRKALGLNDGVERSLWALPGEKRTLHWRQSRMNDFLSLILRVRNVKPPAGFKYSYHSLRHNGHGGVVDEGDWGLGPEGEDDGPVEVHRDGRRHLRRPGVRGHVWVLPALRPLASAAESVGAFGAAPRGVASVELRWWVIAFGRVRTWQCFRARASVLHSVLVEDRRRIRPAPSQRRSG